jgi:hypothetical protein
VVVLAVEEQEQHRELRLHLEQEEEGEIILKEQFPHHCYQIPQYQ